MIAYFKHISFFIFSFIIFFNSSKIQAQWIDHGSYKELKPSTFEIDQLVAPKNDKYFYVTDTSGRYMIFDYNANMIFSKKLRTLDTLNKYYFITNDGKVQIIYKIWDPMNGETRQSDVAIACIQISNDSIIDYFEHSGYASVRSPNNSSFGPTYLDYNLKKKQFLFTYYTKGEQYSGGWGTHTSWESREDIADIDDNYDNFIRIEENYNGYFDPIYSSSKTISSINYVSNIQNRIFLVDTAYYNSENPAITTEGFIPKDARLSNDTNMFIGIDNKIIYFYKFQKNNFYITDTMHLSFEPYQIEFSINNKYLIVKNSNYRIYFYDVSMKSLVDSLVPFDSYKTFGFRVIKDSLGLIVTDYNTIRYYKPAIFSNALLARFTMPKNIYSTNDTVCFTNTSIGEPDKYLWEFGDGEMSHDKHPKHAYSYPGTYIVKLTIAKGDKIRKLAADNPIIVTRKPKANFEVDTTTGFAPLTIHLTDKSTGKIAKRYWNFGDGDSSNTELNPIHIYYLPGVYPIRLVVKDSVSSDTLLKWDYIIVKQTLLVDTSIIHEEIDWTNNKNINDISGFEGFKNDYYIETTHDDVKSYQRLNDNFEQIWTKELFKCKYNSKMKKSNNGNIFLIGDLSQNDTSYCVNSIKSDTTLNKNLNISLSKNYNDIDFVPDLSDLHIFTHSDSLDNNGKLLANLKYFYLNHSDSSIGIKNIINNNYDNVSDHVWFYSILKSDIFKNNISVLMSGIYSFGRNKYLGTYQFYFDQKNNRNYNSNLQETGYVIKHIFVNDSCTVTIFSDNRIFLQNLSLKFIWNNNVNWSGARHWVKTLNGVIIKEAIQLTDTSFIIAGTRNKHCWYAIMDTSGKIIEDHELKNRFGTFRSVSVNSDGSLLFLGSLYKHSLNVIHTYEYQDTNMAPQNQAGLYICRTKPYLKNQPNDIIKPELSDHGSDFSIYPNPATDIIEISVGAKGLSPLQSDLRIYDVFGQTVFTVGAIHELPLQVDVSGLAPGMYFVRIGDSVAKFVKI